MWGKWHQVINALNDDERHCIWRDLSCCLVEKEAAWWVMKPENCHLVCYRQLNKQCMMLSGGEQTYGCVILHCWVKVRMFVHSLVPRLHIRTVLIGTILWESWVWLLVNKPLLEGLSTILTPCQVFTYIPLLTTQYLVFMSSSSSGLWRNPSYTSKSNQKAKNLLSVFEVDNQLLPVLISSGSSFHVEDEDFSLAKGYILVGHKKSKGSALSSQKIYALTTNPNCGTCLVTNLSIPVEMCHLIAGSTDSVTVFFLSFLPLMDLPFLLLYMDIISHGHPCDSLWLILSLTWYNLDSIPLLGSFFLELCLVSPLTHLWMP